MRSLLFVPGDSARKFEKGLASGADALIIDLEDSIVPDRKPAAREHRPFGSRGCRDRDLLNWRGDG